MIEKKKLGRPKGIRPPKSDLEKRYGITQEDYNNLFAQQEGRCAICGTHQSDLNRKLFVDHCHSTKKVKGLLCMSCNVCLGHTKDDTNILKKMIVYLKQ